MGKKVFTTCGVFALIAAAFFVGRTFGAHATWQSYTQTRIQQEKQLQEQMLALDRSFLTNLMVRPNALISGSYALELQYTGKPFKSHSVTLKIDNGKLASMSEASFVFHNVSQNGSVVSWSMDWPDGDEGPGADFIGVIDGNQMSGKVYKRPGSGWHAGEPAAYGVWRLKPATKAVR